MSAEDLKDCRPISLLGDLYKILAIGKEIEGGGKNGFQVSKCFVKGKTNS